MCVGAKSETDILYQMKVDVGVLNTVKNSFS